MTWSERAAALAVLSVHAAAGTVWLGAWPDRVLVIDEAKQKIADTIHLSTGTPHGLQISRDRSTIYAWTVDRNGIEVIDAASRKVVNALTLDDGNRKLRFNSWTPDPSGKLIYLIAQRVEKKQDRFEIGSFQFAVLDLERKKIIRTADFPPDESEAQRAVRTSANLHVSSDGKYLFLMRHGIFVFDTQHFALVEKLDLSEPDSGPASVGVGQQLDSLQNPDALVGMFTSYDPLGYRRVFGIGRFDLSTRKLDFHAVGPMRGALLPLHISPDGKTGYTINNAGTGQNRRREIWAFDLAACRLIRKAEFDGRARYNLAVSGDGKSLYIYAAGYQIEVYDTLTLKPRGTIDIDADTTTEMIVLR